MTLHSHMSSRCLPKNCSRCAHAARDRSCARAMTSLVPLATQEGQREERAIPGRIQVAIIAKMEVRALLANVHTYMHTHKYVDI